MTSDTAGDNRVRRRLAVILASDVAGYSRLIADDEEGTVRRLNIITKRFRELVAGHEGRVFNTAGDAVLAEFNSAVDAVRCALDIQDAARMANMAQIAHHHIVFRIGIAFGDVIVAEDGDLLGDGVNIAARLESVSEPGGICVSDEVRNHVQSKIGVGFRDLGLRELKNISRPVRVFGIGPSTASVNKSDETSATVMRRSRLPRLAMNRIVALSLIFAVTGLLILIGSALKSGRPMIALSMLGRVEESRPVGRLAAQIDFGDVGANIDAILALASFGNAHREYRTEVIESLKSKLTHQPVRVFDETSRAIKRSIVTALVRLRDSDLRNDFADGLLNHQELVGLDLRKVDARGAQFRDAFLISSDFRGADLRNADFSASALRASQFSGASMSGASVSEADWFNAWGLVESQFKSLARTGLRKCPADSEGAHSEQAFIDAANTAYGILFQDWSSDQKEESLHSWNEYAKPGGLCDLAAL